MLRVSDCAGSASGSPVTPLPVLPSASLNSVGTPEDLISQLDGWPACAPVNASPAALRPPPHDSGSGWLAGPSPYDSFIRYSLPVSRRTTRPANLPAAPPHIGRFQLLRELGRGGFGIVYLASTRSCAARWP